MNDLQKSITKELIIRAVQTIDKENIDQLEIGGMVEYLAVCLNLSSDNDPFKFNARLGMFSQELKKHESAQLTKNQDT